LNKKPGLLATLRASTEWFIPTGAVALVFVMLVPLPSFILDLLLTFSITASVLVLLTAIQILRPVQFSVFPSLILLLTLTRLSLDLASTRRILLHGNEGSSAAGKVIEAFGQFVVGGNYIVGFVIFIALIAIQYLVVSHGAVRTAEVTARFTLDAMPGKQMAIDSDLNTGLITADQARTRREMVAREAEFCGSMDGAARFSQRDSLATILIMAINIVAGFLIGVFQQGIPFQQALKTYTILTVGDGLVSIIPSLLVSVAGGIVVTRAGSDYSLGSDIGKQMFKTSRPLWIVSGVLVALAFIPGMPKISFIASGGALMFIAWKMKPSAVDSPAAVKAAATKAGAAGTPVIDPMDAVMKLDELMLEVGIGLVPKAGRPAADAGKIAAQKSGATIGISGAFDSHHRQSFAQGKRVRDLSAWRGDCSLGDAARSIARGQFKSETWRYSGPGDARTSIQLARQVDHSGSSGTGYLRWICGRGPYFGFGGPSGRTDQAECTRPPYAPRDEAAHRQTFGFTSEVGG
jgi:flagellar biosynthesis protein FlhA